MKSLLVAACAALLAPYQCASGDQADRPIEDSAPKALWVLAERFQEKGETGPCETVIAQLIEQYPSSRYAKKARNGACGGAAMSAPDETSSGSEEAPSQEDGE